MFIKQLYLNKINIRTLSVLLLCD